MLGKIKEAGIKISSFSGLLQPSVFNGVRLVLTKPVKNTYSDLATYFTAYGGELLKSPDTQQATHAIHLTSSLNQVHLIFYLRGVFSIYSTGDTAYRWPSTVRHVEVDWLIDSLKLQKLQRTQPYAVTVCPSTN